MPPVQNAPPRVAPLTDTSAPSEPAVATVTEPAIKAQQEEKIPLLLRLRKKFVGGPGEEKATVDAHADSVALARIRALATLAQFSPKDSSMISGRQTGIIDRAELERKIASVEPSVVPPGSTLAETEGRPTGEAAATEEGERGSPVQLELNREEVRYDPGDTRDPFKALVEGQRSGLWTSALPRVDALRLVGILQDYDGAIALFEDMEGYGYILREGDQVKDGFLLTIGTNRAVFQIDEYGWVHTVALEMREDGSKSKHGYTTKPQEE